MACILKAISVLPDITGKREMGWATAYIGEANALELTFLID